MQVVIAPDSFKGSLPAAAAAAALAAGWQAARPGDDVRTIPLADGGGDGGGQHGQRALTAVGQRDRAHLVAGPGGLPPGGQRGGRRGGGQAALERVRGDHDLHGCAAAAGLLTEFSAGLGAGSPSASRMACCTSARSWVASMVSTYSLRPKMASTGSVLSW